MRTVFLSFLVMLGLTATSVAAEFNLVPNPLTKAKVGEWVLLSNLSVPGETVKITVVGRVCEENQQVIVLKREHIDAEGKVGETLERRVKLSSYQDRLDKLDQKADRISREKMLVKDRNITVYVIEWQDTEHDRDVKVWLSNDIPVGGFVRIWSSDPEFPTYEILDFGTN